jgi:hypothetical protein
MVGVADYLYWFSEIVLFKGGRVGAENKQYLYETHSVL